MVLLGALATGAASAAAQTRTYRLQFVPPTPKVWIILELERKRCQHRTAMRWYENPNCVTRQLVQANQPLEGSGRYWYYVPTRKYEWNYRVERQHFSGEPIRLTIP